MEKKLEIIWEGSVPGLAEHRLSLDAFAQALQQLVVAYRRIASNLLAQAESSTGRLHSFAKMFDLQLEQIAEGSAGIVAACVIQDAEPSFWDELLEPVATNAAEALLNDIEAEARGELRNTVVRNYLKALPDGVTGQRYVFSQNGSRREVRIGSLNLPEMPEEMPIVHERLYAIVGVGFPPGDSFVRLKGAEETVYCEATQEQVTKALEFRFGSVYAMIVRQPGKRARLIRLRKAGQELKPFTPEEEERLIYGKWDELLRRLAE